MDSTAGEVPDKPAIHGSEEELTLLGTVLPSLLGLDAQDLRLTMQGPAWSLSVGYFLFVAFDLLWTVASVFVFYDLRSRRLGADLRLRVQALREGRG